LENLAILPQLLMNALISGSILALAAVGLALMYGLLGILNFAHGQLMILGAYLLLFLSQTLSLPLLVAAPLLVFAGIFLAVTILHLTILPFRNRSPLLCLLSTLALSIVIESTLALLFGVNVQTLAVGLTPAIYQFAGVFVTSLQLLIVCSTLLILALVAVIMGYSPFGRAVRALAAHREGAVTLGNNERQTVTIVFALGTLLAIYGGVLVGYDQSLQPYMGTSFTIKAFAAMILGGLGSVGGAIFGSYLLALVENLAIGLDLGPWSIPAGFKDAFAFCVILLALLFRPEGLFQRGQRKF